mgnify:CR=1 FL=1
MATKHQPRSRTVARRAPRGRRGAGAQPTGPALPSVANHPRAGAQVARAKAWAGLGGFALVALLSWRADVPFEDLALRAVAGGIVAYLVAWAAAVAVWRHLVLTELRVVREQRAQQAAEAAAAAAAAREREAEESSS